jgi:FixJ family two-component response regulator
MNSSQPIADSAIAEKQSTIFLVDDDPSALKGLTRLLRAAGYAVRPFGSAGEFLDSGRHDGPGCIVLDIRMPGLSGLDLQAQLRRAVHSMPIIFITGHGDIPMSVEAMKKGAIDFLTKPVEREQLLAAVGLALDKDLAARNEREELGELQQRLGLLTTREREVLSFVIAGRLNKQIAGELALTEATVKVHRGRLMEKLQVTSVAGLVRLTQRAGIPAAKSTGR